MQEPLPLNHRTICGSQWIPALSYRGAVSLNGTGPYRVLGSIGYRKWFCI
ncbi:hypothetical protein BH20ACI3_BH20ACI3_43030 [soil metagenome]